jgi:hypothetical protein
MGQAKLRGDRDQRITQALSAKTKKIEDDARFDQMHEAAASVPTPGLYVSNKTGARFIVEDVFMSTAEEMGIEVALDEDDDEYTSKYFVASVVEESDAADMGAMGYELDQYEWLSFALLHGLYKA